MELLRDKYPMRNLMKKNIFGKYDIVVLKPNFSKTNINMIKFILETQTKLIILDIKFLE